MAGRAAALVTETLPITQLERAQGMRIEARDVSHEFALHGAPLPVIDRVSFVAGRGEFIAFLGPSGCGKSTLLRLIAGLETATSGELTAEGVEIHGTDPQRGLVFQDPTLFPWRTVWNNIALGLEARGLLRCHSDQINEALELVGLSGFRNAFPHQLSGGMAQRVALARALVNQPNLLLLDEPLGKLDSLTRMTMQGELLNLWQRTGFTALLVTHDVEEAVLLASRVIVLSPRPTSIQAEIANTLPYPRHRDDPRILQLRRHVLEYLSMDSSL
jgi:NitT/TauT family transport system ATP-binding protein